MSIQIPSPSQYVSHQTIEDIAIAYNKLYRDVMSEPNGYPIDIEAFIDQHFQISIVHEEIEEPEDTMLMAFFSNGPDKCITINAKYSSLFDSRPELLRSTYGHELAHYILRHYEYLDAASNSLSLFSNLESKSHKLHRRSWAQNGLTRQDIARLVKYALINKEVRDVIAKLEDRLEPEWMFRQAEHFSMCLSIPKDRLLEIIDNNFSLEGWSPIYDLAKRFGVSPSMMSVRLQKLNIVQIGTDNKPHKVVEHKQSSLFSF